MANGTAYLDVSVDMLQQVLLLLPSGYEVTGSKDSAIDKVVRLTVCSEMLVGEDNHITCVVTDAGSTRRVMVLPI